MRQCPPRSVLRIIVDKWGSVNFVDEYGTAWYRYTTKGHRQIKGPTDARLPWLPATQEEWNT